MITFFQKSAWQVSLVIIRLQIRPKLLCIRRLGDERRDHSQPQTTRPLIENCNANLDSDVTLRHLR